MKTLNSNMITFLDITDTKKPDLYIASNLPTTQIYNTNSSTYSPDWTLTHLILTPTVYMNSTDVTSKITFAWYRKSGNDNPTAISTSDKTLTISTNELSSSSGIISYICEAYYGDKTVTNQITFARVDTGLNGVDGTSVTIKGVAYATSTPVTGEAITLYYDEACTIPLSATTSLTTGDGYLVDGYLCVYTISKTFISAGKIQGPKGTDAVTFQIYAPNGYILTKNIESLILQTVAYNGHTEITTGAAYQWSQYVDNVWEEINGATEASFTITKEDVLDSKSYRCIMTYNSKTYASTVTVCARGEMYKVLWTGAVQSGDITLNENFRNFKFLTCILGNSDSPWEITLGAFWDIELDQLHFGAIFVDDNGYAGENLYGARFMVNSTTSLNLIKCGTKNGPGAYLRKIVGWR